MDDVTPTYDRFSPIGMYGDAEVFKGWQQAGFDEVAFGGGPWLNCRRVVGAFAAFAPDGRVATLESRKIETDDGHTMHAGQEVLRFKRLKRFDRHVKKAQLEFGERRPLQAVIEQLNAA